MILHNLLFIIAQALLPSMNNCFIFTLETPFKKSMKDFITVYFPFANRIYAASDTASLA
jgi:hypothetical protein